MKRGHAHPGLVTSPPPARTAPGVLAFRDHLRQHRALAAWLLTLVLLLKVLVPSGYMLDTSGGRLGLVQCSGMAPMKAMAMPGMAGHATHEDRKDDQKADQPCAFAGLAAPSLAAADPILLALAVVFVTTTIVRRGAQRPFGTPVYLRPPLRAPPAHG